MILPFRFGIMCRRTSWLARHQNRNAPQIRQHHSNRAHRRNHEAPNNAKRPNERNSSWHKPLGFATIAATLVSPTVANNNFGSVVQDSAGEQFISWNDFCYKMLARGEVKSIIIYKLEKRIKIILHEGAIIDGRRVTKTEFDMQEDDLDAFEGKLRDFERSMGISQQDAVPITYVDTSPFAVIVYLLTLYGIYYVLRKSFPATGTQNFMSSFTKPKFTLVNPTTRATDGSSIKFKDVAGLQEAKTEVMEFVDYLKNSEKFLKLGAKLPKGVLLLGPPGCGKTLLAKAVATEANVPFLALSGSDFVEMIGGLGASRVRSLFKSAKKMEPCIIYIDEIDSIGKKRSSESQIFNRESEQTLNQLLVEMDGMTTNKGIILLASTNRAEVLDKALLRPGRFDRHILIDLPTLEERREIFKRHASKIKLSDPIDDIAPRIAQLTPGMSGADIANVCNEAALHAARKDRKSVSIADIEFAIDRVVGGTEKRSNTITPTEKRIIAFHESGHALVGWLLEHADPLLKISIVPRTTNVLGFAQYLPSDRLLYSPEQLFDRMCVSLGGRSAELIKFNHLSSGAEDDLKRVTELASAQIREFGFDPVIGNIAFDKQDPADGLKKPYSDGLQNLIDQRVAYLVKAAFERTQKLINDNIDKLNLLAETLVVKEVMSNKEIEEILGPRPKATIAQT